MSNYNFQIASNVLMHTCTVDFEEGCPLMILTRKRAYSEIFQAKLKNKSCLQA